MLHHNHSLSGSTVSISRGDIVWARVQFPHEWWPGLVLTIDVFGVLVSFFKQDIPPRYILESEVVPFEECFRSIMGRRQNAQDCDQFFALLDSALKLSGQRIISSLSCRCQLSSRVDEGGISFGRLNSTFRPKVVLGFVSEVAVWPWVDVLDFVDAIRYVSQVQAFRRYCAVKQKLVYKETRDKGQYSKLQRYSSFSEKIPSITQGAAEPECESQILSKTVEKNLAVGAIKSLSSRTIFDENHESLYENQPLPVLETPNRHRNAHFLTEASSSLNSLSLDMFHRGGESLQSLKQSLLRFENTSHRGIVEACFRNCSKCKAQLIDNANRGHGDGEAICLTRKRKQLDQLTLCGCSFKRQRDETFVSLQMIKSENKRNVSDVFISLSALAECFSSCNGTEMGILQAFLSQSPVKLEIQNLCSTEGLYVTSTCRSSWPSLLYNASSLSSTSFLKDVFCPIGFLEIGRVQEPKGSADISKPTKMNEVDQEKCHNLPLQRPVACESTKSAFVTTYSSNCDVNARASLPKGLLEDGLNVEQIQLQISNDGKTAINLRSRDCMMKNKDIHQSVAYYSVSNSNVGRQLKKLAPSPLTSLYMKFPKDFNLPSKGELIKKFSVFGLVDYLATKVFQCAGSARVAFIHGADAMAAYLYSKRKPRFGQANVRFWLDPYEQKRRYGYLAPSSPSAENPVGSPLKSCLKISNPVSKENGKKHYNMGFKMDKSSGSSSLSLKSPSTGNSVGPPLKSCLKQSNTSSEKDGKKRYRVRFTLVT